jgi:trehalose-6-phosphatase
MTPTILPSMTAVSPLGRECMTTAGGVAWPGEPSCDYDRDRRRARTAFTLDLRLVVVTLARADRLRGTLAERISGKRPLVFLDYDGTLTPIVDRPEEAIISEGMREVVRGLAGRCTVCVVSGRDRAVVQRLMGVDDLVVAGMPLYIGDDITDEHAFQALSGRGIGILVADPADPEVAGRRTAATYVLADTDEVERCLDGLAR